jgi:hypothetical protein
VTEPPGVCEEPALDFTMLSSARFMTVSVSFAVSLLLTGSVVPRGVVTEAALVIEPFALCETLAVRVYVAVAPTGRLTVSEMEPVPFEVQAAPPTAEQVQVAPDSCDGSGSLTVAPTTADGPRFVTAMV